MFKTVETHTLGEPTRIILSGFPKYNAKSMIEYKEYLEANFDHYRSALMCEPRGHKDMVGALLAEPISKEADAGVIYMDANRWINMCGHATIGVAMMLINKKLITVVEPITEITLETPAGLIKVEVEVQNRKAVSVSFINVPSFLYLDNCKISYNEKEVDFAISYSGSFFALVNAEQFDKNISLESVEYYKNLGVELLKIINEKYKVRHPLLNIGEVANIEFYQHNEKGQKNIVVSQEGQVDRSPCGTGTCAKLAYLYSTNKISLNKKFVNQSFTGVSFNGEITDICKIGHYEAIIPKITGMAYISGESTFLIDEDDPLKHGFNI